MFKLNCRGDVAYYTIPSFENTGIVRHGFSTRRGGVSEGMYSSMNLRIHCDDSRENVLENFKMICDTLGFERDRLVLSHQVHEDKIVAVDYSDCGNGLLYENKFESADALITDKPGLPIAVFAADCVPLFFLDPKRRVIALAHSGWRGTVAEIGKKTVIKMRDSYGCEPSDILAAIGPSIQEECFEVGDEVAECFINKFGAETVKKHGDKFHVNMQKAIKLQLLDAGVKEENIDDCGICTYCEHDLLFSHRYTNGNRGVMGAFLELKES